MDNSNDYVIVNGIPRPKWAVEAVDRFLVLAQTKSMWEVIDFIVAVYFKKHPEYMEKLVLPTKNVYGATKDKGMRSLMNIPMDLKDTIDFFYKDEIKNIGEIKFWRKFVKKYPSFTIAEKI